MPFRVYHFQASPGFVSAALLLILVILPATLAQSATSSDAPIPMPTGAGDPGDIVPNRYIITLKSSVPGPQIFEHIRWVHRVQARSLEARAGNITQGVTKVWETSLKAYSGEFSKSTIQQINNSPEVLAVEPVRVVSVYQSLTTQANATWNLGSISHRTLGSTNYVYQASTRNDLWAYVVDTGVNVAHVEFQGRAYNGYNAVANTKMADLSGHGTHCAGIIASKTYGVSKNANIMAVKVIDTMDSTTEIVLAGFEWAVNNITATGRVSRSVISLSLGGPKSVAFNTAVTAAFNKGIFIVAAAGNDAADASTSSPASATNAFAVGAIDSTNTRASFSNYGSTVGIFAPGVNIVSLGTASNTALLTMSGTSMAAPHVAGLSLYLKAKEGIATPASLAKRIKSLGTQNVVKIPGPKSPNLALYNGAA